jgi:integrase/recombinase XerC
VAKIVIQDPRFAALVDSWVLALEAENKSPTTVVNYTGSIDMLVRWLIAEHDKPAPEEVTAEMCRGFLAELLATREPATARTRWNGMRQFFGWCLTEGELEVSPMAEVKPPEVPDKPVDMLTEEQLKLVIAACQGPKLVDRRDEALILLYCDSGARLSEIAGAMLDDLDLRDRSLRVMGKGRRERIVPFGARTARALDRYLRMRGRQPFAEQPWLWLSGKDGKRMTANAVQQMLRRRGREVGIEGLHAHQFRHGFADAWLSSGGAEGDLMELAGWRSRQMLLRYGAKRRSERAREAYRGRSPMDRL